MGARHARGGRQPSWEPGPDGDLVKPDLDRVRILEAEGYDVVAPQWFDQRISEIPLESFPLDELAKRNAGKDCTR